MTINPVGVPLQPDFEKATGTRYKTDLDNAILGGRRLALPFLAHEGGDPLWFTGGDVDAGTDKISVANDYPADLPLKLELGAGATAPGNVTPGTTYYAKAPTASDLQLSASAGGATLDITSAGSGDMLLVPQPSMKVYVRAGHLWDGVTLAEQAGQFTAAFSAPASNPRIDRIVIDPGTGAASVVTGSEAASPSAPAIPTGKLPCAQVRLETSTTAISNQEITDERALWLSQTPILYRVPTQVGTASATEEDLHSVTISGGLLASDGDSVEIEAHFTGDGSNPAQIRLFLDGSSVQAIFSGSALPAAGEGTLAARVRLMRRGATTLLWAVFDGSGQTGHFGTATITLASDFVVKFTGTRAYQEYMMVFKD